MEAIVLPVLFHGKYHAAVAGHCQSVFNGGGGVQNGLGVALQRQYAFCAVVVENNLIARLRHTGFGRRNLPFHLEELQGKLSLRAHIDGVEAAPGSEVVLIFHVGIADSVLNIVSTVLILYQFPLVILLSEGHTGVGIAHTDVLTVIGEGPGAVSIVNYRPHIGIGKAGNGFAGDGHSGSLIVEAVIAAGEGFAVSGVVNHDLIAVGNRRIARLGRIGHLAAGFPFYPEKGKLIGIAVGIAADSCILITTELVFRSLVTGQGNGIISLSQEAELTIFVHGNCPHIVAGLDSVFVATLGGNGHTVAVGELHAALSHGNVPDCPSRICQLVSAHCRLDSCNPTTVQNTRGIAGVGDHHILTGCQLFNS